jgi:Fungal protein kinase
MTSLRPAHEFLCDQGILHRDVSAGNIMLAASTPPEAGAEGFLMDLEFARIKRSSLDTTRTIAVLPVRAPGGGMTAPTIRSHTIFGPDVMRGAVMTVRLPRCHGAVDLLNNI